jgi:hypothetical protein
MRAITVANEVTINHSKLGAEVWEWNAEQQADFLIGLAQEFRANGGHGIYQISYIAADLRDRSGAIDDVRWLNDKLTEYLKEEGN